MIDEVDDALRTLIRRDALNGADVEIVFDAPTKEWATRRNALAIDVYLYDIREDLGRRSVGAVDVRSGNGTVTGRHAPPRYFKFSYLLTACTQRPEDEHRLLSSVLRCFLRYDTLPADVVTGGLAAQGYPVAVRIAMPPPQDRSISDVWSSLGGELKASLDVVTTVAIDARALAAVAPPVLEPPRISIGNGDGAREIKGGRRAAPGGVEEVAAAAPAPPEKPQKAARRRASPKP